MKSKKKTKRRKRVTSWVGRTRGHKKKEAKRKHRSLLSITSWPVLEMKCIAADESKPVPSPTTRIDTQRARGDQHLGASLHFTEYVRSTHARRQCTGLDAEAGACKLCRGIRISKRFTAKIGGSSPVYLWNNHHCWANRMYPVVRLAYFLLKQPTRPAKALHYFNTLGYC